jgi:hypothetical protein
MAYAIMILTEVHAKRKFGVVGPGLFEKIQEGWLLACSGEPSTSKGYASF